MSEQVTTPETVPQESDVSSGEGVGADDSQFTLEELNEFLGKDFKDKDTALKSVKDTYSYVGKQDELRQGVKNVMESTGKDEQTVLQSLEKLMSEPETTTPEQTQEPKTNEEIEALKAQYSEDRFFDKNPEFEQIKGIVKPLKQSPSYQSLSWDEFAQTDEVKNLMETYSGYSEAQSKKSVVESNPRLGAASDKMDSARTAMSEGNDQAAKANAVGAVVDLIRD